MTVLEQICAEKLDHIRVMRAKTPLPVLEEKIKNQPPGRGFKYQISRQAAQGEPALIAEVKKASPSKGIIRADFDPIKIATAYESAGATCLSVLTDTPYFQGKDNDLAAVRSAVKLPLLRKDFMLDPYQIFESRALGADCVLLIMAALTLTQAAELYALARALTMDVLVEIHDEDELAQALTFKPDMIGVNSRNLKTLEVDTGTARRIAPLIPGGIVKIAESGIHNHGDIVVLQKAGYHAFLVGESLMRQDDIAAAVRSLMGKT